MLHQHNVDVDKSKVAPNTDPSQPKLPFATVGAALKGAATTEDILFQLTLWLANSFRPYTTIEDPDFRELIEMLRPGFKLPKRDKIRVLARKISLLIKEQVLTVVCAVLIAGLQVIAFLKVKAKWLCFTTDGWTSRQGKQHVAITVHGLTADFNMFSFCLAATEMPGAQIEPCAFLFIVSCRGPHC